MLARHDASRRPALWVWILALMAAVAAAQPRTASPLVVSSGEKAGIYAFGKEVVFAIKPADGRQSVDFEKVTATVTQDGWQKLTTPETGRNGERAGDPLHAGGPRLVHVRGIAVGRFQGRGPRGRSRQSREDRAVDAGAERSRCILERPPGGTGRNAGAGRPRACGSSRYRHRMLQYRAALPADQSGPRLLRTAHGSRAAERSGDPVPPGRRRLGRLVQGLARGTPLRWPSNTARSSWTSTPTACSTASRPNITQPRAAGASQLLDPRRRRAGQVLLRRDVRPPVEGHRVHRGPGTVGRRPPRHDWREPGRRAGAGRRGTRPAVSAVVALVPAMCDFTGPLVNRLGGWPMPLGRGVESGNAKKIVEAVRYCDNVHLAKRSRAETLIFAGLIDTTCSPAGIFATYNTLPGGKQIVAYPHKPHNGVPKEDLWLGDIPALSGPVHPPAPRPLKKCAPRGERAGYARRCIRSGWRLTAWASFPSAASCKLIFRRQLPTVV